MLGVQRDAHRLQKDLYSRRRNIDISARITILYSSSSYLSMKAVPMKRQREDSPQSPALIEALDAIITPQSCFVHYDASLAASLAELKASIIASDPDLQSYQETVAQQQSPQGDVQRSSSDKRYMLSLLCINMGRLEELNPNGGDGVRRFYAEALLWHPDSIEAGFCLGVFLRHAVTAPEQLQLVHDLWLRAYTTGRAYNFFRRPSFAGNPGVPYASYNRMIQNREKGIMKELSDMLILHNCQQGDLATATVYLKAFRYQYKLSQAVLCYNKTSLSVDKAEGTVKKAVCGYAGGVDSAVSPEVLARLQHVFRPDSPFWREHNYDFYSNASRSVGYFSYVYPFRELAPENVVELAISRIYDIVAVKFPEIAAKATIGAICFKLLLSINNLLILVSFVAEWWVHSRPHSCGHQFHFDSDETLIYAGKKAQHPIMSCVLYLTPDSDGGESVGGPTVVTNQTLQSEGLATEGFMFLPRENRMVTFDARYLHGT